MAEPFIPFPNCAEIVSEGTLNGQATFLTMMVEKASPITPEDLETIANIVAGWIVDFLLDWLHNLLTFNQVKVTDLTSQFGPVFVGGTGLPHSGAGTGAIVPNNVSLVTSFGTALRGRVNRGRNYVPGELAANLADSGHFTSTEATNIATAYATLIDALSVAGFTPVIGSRQENGVRRTVGKTEPITSVTGKVLVGTQRRRVPGHGI